MRLINILKEEKGEATLISLVKFILLFTVIGLGIEFYRIQTYHSTLQTKIEIIAQDALELSILDEFRQERVSKIYADDAEYNLYDLLKTELKLDDSLTPIQGSLLQTRLEISYLNILEGTHALVGGRYYNTSYPSIHIKGYTKQRIVLIPLLPDEMKLISIPFDVFIENRRYD